MRGAAAWVLGAVAVLLGCGREPVEIQIVPSWGPAELAVLLARGEAGELVAGTPTLMDGHRPTKIETDDQVPFVLRALVHDGGGAQQIRECGVRDGGELGFLPAPVASWRAQALDLTRGGPQPITLEREAEANEGGLRFSRCDPTPDTVCSQLQVHSLTLDFPINIRRVALLDAHTFVMAGEIEATTDNVLVVLDDTGAMLDIHHLPSLNVNAVAVAEGRYAYFSYGDSPRLVLYDFNARDIVATGSTAIGQRVARAGDQVWLIDRQGPTRELVLGSTEALARSDLPSFLGEVASGPNGSLAATNGPYVQIYDGQGWHREEPAHGVASAVLLAFIDEGLMVADGVSAALRPPNGEWAAVPLDIGRIMIRGLSHGFGGAVLLGELGVIKIYRRGQLCLVTGFSQGMNAAASNPEQSLLVIAANSPRDDSVGELIVMTLPP